MILRYISILMILSTIVQAQTINRYGSTAANFLEIGVGSANAAMGDAGVTVAEGPSAVYWNPAALAFITKNENAFMLQPWVLDINMMFIGSTIHVNRVGTFGLSLTHMGYGDMEVTSMAKHVGIVFNFSET